VLVICSYEAQKGNEIDLIEGEPIYNIEQVEDGWWLGTTKEGQRGLFPASYVEESTDQAQEEAEKEAEVHLAVTSVGAARDPGTSSSQKAQQGQKKKKWKPRDDDDDLKFSKALQTISEGRLPSESAPQPRGKNRYLVLDRD